MKGGMRLIRPLTETEKKVVGKYEAELVAARATVAQVEQVLKDLAHALADDEGSVIITSDALYKPSDADLAAAAKKEPQG